MRVAAQVWQEPLEWQEPQECQEPQCDREPQKWQESTRVAGSQSGRNHKSARSRSVTGATRVAGTQSVAGSHSMPGAARVTRNPQRVLVSYKSGRNQESARSQWSGREPLKCQESTRVASSSLGCLHLGGSQSAPPEVQAPPKKNKNKIKGHCSPE